MGHGEREGRKNGHFPFSIEVSRPIDTGCSIAILTCHNNRSVFRVDGKMVEVHELNVLDLEPAPEGNGVSGLWVSSSNVYMDLSGFRK